LNNDFGITVRGSRGLLDDAGEGEGRAINLGEEKAVQYDLKKILHEYRTISYLKSKNLVEVGICTAG